MDGTVKIFDILMNISTELIAAAVTLILGIVASKMPRSIDKHRLQKFFGNAILLKEDFKIVYGTLSRLPSEDYASENAQIKWQYQKTYHDGRSIKLRAIRNIITGEVVRSFSYIFHELAKFVNKPVTICTDEDAFKNLNNTFITFGGPVVNEITEWAINEKTNKFLKFLYPEDPIAPWKIVVVTDTDKQFSFEKLPQGKDYGIILKIKNSRFPKHFFFVCAGIGMWGSSGAAWYLANHWRTLYKEFKSKEFGIVVEVNLGSDTSAIRVFP